MLRVMMVDDDLPMLSHLKNMLEWEKYGFVLCGEANGGKSAGRMADERKPDIVITDMSMPGMDGLELIDYFQKFHPRTKIIAVSGYSDVHYIRNSMRNGAVDYILKHELSPGLLLDVLGKASDKLVEERIATERSAQLQLQLERSRSMLKEDAIRRLVQEDPSDESVSVAALPELGIEFYSGGVTAVVVSWDGYMLLKERLERKDLDNLAQSFRDIAGNILADADKAYLSQTEESKFVLLFTLHTSSRLLWHTTIHEALRRIRTSVKRQLNLSVSCSVSVLCDSVADIPKAYSEAERALEERFYAGTDAVIWPESARKPKETEVPTVDVRLERELSLRLSRLDEEGVGEVLNDLFDQMIEAHAAYKSVQMACVELIHLANRSLKETGISEKEVFGDIGANPYETLLQFDTVRSLRDWMTEVYRDLLRALRSRQAPSTHSDLVRRTLEWIRRHHAEPITLQLAADEACVNSSYLSRVFKEETKLGFADYVTRFRVDQAKKMIREGETDLKEIVRITGFSSYNYFFTVFKKVTGITPLEYEKMPDRTET
ncbi:response regulator [Cohnella terricola]|uniref:Response regulator n=1 Tax=Cohnella terricola TaxID=1289167 RepID=A0A559JTZ3_9BACL|nr:response regulator [Cohnella terricola]TVY03327.1 response regulator [Cohnella terricola]